MNNLVENQKESAKPKEQFGKARIWLNRGIACLLFFAAGMKAWQLATVPVLGEGILHARWFNILVVEFELAFGLWLLFGFLPKLTRWVTIALFTTFAGVSLYKVVSGEASCGCFGTATINPWWTMGLDMAIAGLAFLFRRKNQRIINSTKVTQFVFTYCLIVISLGLLLYVAIAQTDIQHLRSLGQVLDHGSTIVLEPQLWTGKELPLRNYCDIGEEIMSGRWFVFLSRSGCLECQEVSILIEDIAKRKRVALAVIELTPSNNTLDFRSEKCLAGFMNREKQWFAETPVILEVDEGQVNQVFLRNDLKRMQSKKSRSIERDYVLTYGREEK